MGAPNPLSEQDVAEARAELSEGKPVTVWFTPAAVGVPANGSAKVISIGDVAEGDFIQVKPAGTRDTMFCSPTELTRARPPRGRGQRSAGRAPKTSEPPEETPPATKGSDAKPTDSGIPDWTPVTKVSKTKLSDTKMPASKPLDTKMPEKTSSRSRSTGGRAAGRAAEVTVTLNASSEGEWTVEVAMGKKRTVRPTPVQPAEVAKAARELPSAVAEAIEASLEAARQRQLERVERLRAELDAAQQALHELSG
jgi:Family of unknown function (DUF6319)